ncbi:MAG: bifunctional metallophosphatase/5'-nucleotidase [Lachnospiraceae bacterium]|nr:bifunctional metallophosphatase/5'-nucleotidase [Lachnospiraceae bacterium]
MKKQTAQRKNRLSARLSIVLALILCLMTCACGGQTGVQEDTVSEQPGLSGESTQESTQGSETAGKVEETAAPEETSEEFKGIYVLCTSDVHCGIDRGFGYVGLKQIRDTLEQEGYKVLLVDDGDSIQGEPIGTVSKGETIIEFMNALPYDVAIPGNHEFDYGMDRFLELTQKADFPYISCNFTKKGEPVFKPYVIKEIEGIKIAFVGITTPKTLTTSTPAYFQDENGEYIYGFTGDDDGSALYEAVQKAVDDARAEGASLVYVMAHLGLEEECRPWTYEDVISHTTGIDVFLDGHSHDNEQIEMKDQSGDSVTRLAVGTKLSAIGYSRISPEGEIEETGAWHWSNKVSAPELLRIENEISKKVEAAKEKLSSQLDVVVGHTDVELIIYDPVEKDNSGKPIRMVRRAETNLGDLCADAFRDQGKADIGVMNGGGIRVSIEKGDITYGDIINVNPYGNELCVVELTGAQIQDALEWGCRAVPGEAGAFLQVSGLTFDLDASVESSCIMDENGMFKGVGGKRRVSNIKVGDEPLDLNRKYTLAGHNYMLLEHGDGYTMFDGAKLLQDKVKLDNMVLIDYIADTLGGVIGEEYADPYGQGRIHIIGG